MSDIEDFLDPILAAFTDSFQIKLNGYLVTAYLRGSAQMIQWGRTKLTDRPIFYEGPPIRQAINYANKHGAEMVTKMNQETKERLAKVIGDAIENKRGIPGLARDIRKEFADMTKYRSELIAKTETRDALFHASQDRMEAMGVTGKEWVLGSGGREGNCDDCRANAAAGIISVEDEFPVPQYDIHPGCLLPNVIIEASNIVAGSRAFYSGKAIEIITENGNRLAITPNHMILTESGFVKAKSLHEGDYVISSLDSEGILSGMNPNDNYRPARIADIWNSLMMKQGMVRRSVPVTPHYFYGDAGAFDGDVDVIYPDGFLLNDFFNPFSLEHISEKKLNSAGADKSFLDSTSSLFSLQNGRMPTLGGNMGLGGNGVAVLDRHSGHANRAGLAIGSQPNASLFEAVTDNIPFYTRLSRQFQSRFAGLIALDKIIKIRDFYSNSHVYDLQSLDGLYIGNRIVVKNCTCAIAPAMIKR